ncbi:MAG TPA: 30S ribosomal protein S21 [Candidatus Pacearchaeota archaeon]|jgi:ribosomal protein S21|nr:30S ribosomal protein S21 [Candidatus Pacearchaeota archaeon]HRR94684.1 30S ribosomal protein S21 [Candidatus Paceibacterota bacterium]HPC30364.1 30S ribosomal protein S21 [Candidatus Pacearchaeota archaeon]HQG09177.1 30S ribosomal protein S21 [Candidatus Pacearchaeota archaeon]HQH20403.1 30S ribosomal protein S21 [Candidatus Pacearchaeota archaeon]
MKIQKQVKETSQSLVYRFTKAVQKSGVLVEARKRAFFQRQKSRNLRKRAALLREEKKKEFLRLKKLGKN